MTNETVKIQTGVTRVKNALKNLNRRDRLDMIKALFPDLSNEAIHKITDNLDLVKVASGTQMEIPAAWLE